MVGSLSYYLLGPRSVFILYLYGWMKVDSICSFAFTCFHLIQSSVAIYKYLNNKTLENGNCLGVRHFQQWNVHTHTKYTDDYNAHFCFIDCCEIQSTQLLISRSELMKMCLVVNRMQIKIMLTHLTYENELIIINQTCIWKMKMNYACVEGISISMRDPTSFERKLSVCDFCLLCVASDGIQQIHEMNE